MTHTPPASSANVAAHVLVREDTLEAKQESPLRLFAVALGWILLAVAGAVVLIVVAGIFVGILDGTAAIKSTKARLLATIMGSVGIAGVLLISARVRGRIVGNGDIDVGVGNAPLKRWWLVVLLGGLTLAYAMALSVGGYNGRPGFVPRLCEIAPLLYFAFVFLMLFVSPISEELFVRGWLWTGLRKYWGPLSTAYLSSGLWLVLHLGWGTKRVIALVPMAIILPLARHFARSVRAIIALHAIYNLAIVCGPWIIKASSTI